jgi:uncharacterized oligopeptide transporter (OPT) family protein
MSSPTQTAPAHKPYVPDEASLPEFTWQAVITGALLGIVFGASSLYLVLKVGMTVSASIPVAVLSVTLFRAFSRAFGLRKAGILENNIVQTTGSAGESIAFGVGVTMPALMMLGFEMDIGRVMVVSLLGGVLGILMMIPLRRAFIVRLHGKAGEPGKLLYPEGTACAQVLISGEKGAAGGLAVFAGFGIAFVHKFITEGMGLLKGTVRYTVEKFNRAAELSSDLAPELLGVGYIIGLRTAGVLMAGGVLGYLVIAPAIAIFGDGMTVAIPPADKPIKDMSVGDLRTNFILYIGAGCVAAAGIISMFRTLPMIVRSIAGGLAGMRGAAADLDARARRSQAQIDAVLAALPETTAKPAPGAPPRPPTQMVRDVHGDWVEAVMPEAPGPVPRTENDMSMKVVFGGSLLLIGGLAAFLATEVQWTAAVIGAGLVVVFGFLFVTVSSRLTGEIGSSSNPISGMTVATLALTCLIFLALGMTSPAERVLALSIGGVVCIAASNGGTTSQDLKTGFLVGGTPRLMQWAIIVGAVSSALVIGATLLFFNRAGTVYTARSEHFPTVLTATGGVYADGAADLFSPDRKPGWVKAGANNRVLEIDADFARTLAETVRYNEQTFRVWRPDPRHFGNLGSGKFLVDDAGKVRYFVDPAITGKIAERDDGSRVNLKFEAPKTQVMALIINGVLGGMLNWALVLMGAMIAVTLELCGVSSLAFAVGVYVPMSVSVPIFIGGLLRYGLDRYFAPRPAGGDEAAAIAAAESSPGVLLSSGYIAGGTLAGVVVAFLEFAPGFKQMLDFSGSATAQGRAGDSFAIGAFAVLVLMLIVVGAGKLLSPRSEPAFPVKGG